MKKYSKFVNTLGPGSSSLFDLVSGYLIKTEATFLKQKGGIFRNEVCSLLTLLNKNKSKYEETRKAIVNEFNENMFKYSGYPQVILFSRKMFNSLIEDAISSENITDAEISAVCGDKQKEGIKNEIEALLLSYLYLFIDTANVRSLGPGDIAAEDYFILPEELHAELTMLVNNLTNATFPPSVFLFPHWFRMPRHCRH